MKLSDDQSDIFEALAQEGDGIMLGLGYVQQDDGSWREEDIDAVVHLIEEHGLGWARKQSALMPK